jgi:hypothetical protein
MHALMKTAVPVGFIPVWPPGPRPGGAPGGTQTSSQAALLSRTPPLIGYRAAGAAGVAGVVWRLAWLAWLAWSGGWCLPG